MDEGYMQHPNERIRQKIIELCDELCMWERNTGRESTLLLLEGNFRFWADSGKPLPTRLIASMARMKLNEATENEDVTLEEKEERKRDDRELEKRGL